MRIKVSELTGTALDWAVMKIKAGQPMHTRSPFLVAAKYSTEWEYGGPIIEREGISVCENAGRWVAGTSIKGQEYYGPTPLIAAMRCYVASKLGDEVDIPAELVQSNPI